MECSSVQRKIYYHAQRFVSRVLPLKRQSESVAVDGKRQNGSFYFPLTKAEGDDGVTQAKKKLNAVSINPRGVTVVINNLESMGQELAWYLGLPNTDILKTWIKVSKTALTAMIAWMHGREKGFGVIDKGPRSQWTHIRIFPSSETHDFLAHDLPLRAAFAVVLVTSNKHYALSSKTFSGPQRTGQIREDS